MSSLTKKLLVGGVVVVLGFLLVYFAGPLTESESGSGGEEVTLPSGLKYQDLKVGTGPEAKKGDKVKAHYTGWLKDGTKFDSSRDHGDKPAEFTLKTPGLIPGWVEGVPGMKVGGKRKLIIPPALGYGSEGSPPDIPPNAELTFEIELLEIVK